MIHEWPLFPISAPFEAKSARNPALPGTQESGRGWEGANTMVSETSSTRRMAAFTARCRQLFLLAAAGLSLRKMGMPGLCDFAFGNPHDMPIPAYVEAIARRRQSRTIRLVRL